MVFLYWKALHVIALVTWFAGLFYLPRLFVYHAMAHDKLGQQRFCIMERKLYYFITWPGGVATTLSGIAMVYLQPSHLALGWFQIKLVMVALLWAFHLYCGCHLKRFARTENNKTHVYFRFLNEMPTIVLIVCVILAVFEPHIRAFVRL